MIYDTFLFGDACDLLECRLTELQGVPGLVHVVVESPVDHQGHPKPLHYADSRERFSPWAERIVHVVTPGRSACAWLTWAGPPL